VSLLAVFAVSAVASGSASATCYKWVGTAPTTGFSDPSCLVASATGEYVKVKELNTEIKTGEWCGTIEPAGTGAWNNLSCTEAAGTKNFIKVKVPGFWICKEAGTEEYTEHLCKTKAAGGKWSYLPVKAAELFAFEGKSGPSKLEGTLAGLRTIIECTEDTIKGELGAAGKTKNVTITYEKCKLFTVSKYIKTELPKCEVPNIKTETLNDSLIMGKGVGPEDEFEPASGTTFAKIAIKGKECSLGESSEAVTGKQICQLPEATVGKVEHEVVCSPSGGSLLFGGKPASYYGTANIKLGGTAAGWSWGAEP